MPRVSFITPVYNGALYVSEAIKSVLAQTFTDFEYIIVDDGSTDNTFEIVSGFKDKRIILLRNETNLKLVKSRNKAVAAAKGDYIAFLDHDDIAMPNRLSVQVDFLDKNPDFGLVGGWVTLIDNQGNPGPALQHSRHSPEESKMSLLLRNKWANSSLMARRSMLDDPPYSEDYPLSEDYYFIYRLSTKAKCYILKKIILKYRVHATNISSLQRDQLIENALRIKQSMLKSIDCQMSDDELKTYGNIENFILPPSIESLDKTERCLQTLRHSVCQSNYVADGVADKVLGEEWLLFCVQSTSLGFEVWRKYRSSNLSRSPERSLWREVSLFLKSCIKYHRSSYK